MRFLSWLFFFLLAVVAVHPLPCEDKECRRVLFVMDKLLLGGIEKAFLSLVNGWDIPNTKVEIFLTSRGGVLEERLRKDFPVISAEQAFSRSYDVAIAYAHLMKPRYIIQNVNAKRRVQWIHSDLSASKWGHPIRDRKGCERIDAFICVSEKVAEASRKIRPRLGNKIFVVHNVLDEALIRENAKEKISCYPKDGMLTAVSVGRLAPEKGYDRAVRVHNRLEKEGIHFRWYIVGEGHERLKLRKKIKEYGLEKKFILVGSKLNPYPYVVQADFFVLPSLFEGCSIAVNEAKVLRKPILVTDVAGVREQIESGRNGLIVDNSEEAIYEGLKKILLDRSLRNKFSVSLSNFTYDNATIYKELERLFFTESPK